ncbi:MAG: phosphoenolpyruvate carboxykinase (ATP) [Actinomycetota bacterium]|nr:phosphoenolpyruvate carboxykinase (ATP) [Actinomycetota bacterium]
MSSTPLAGLAGIEHPGTVHRNLSVARLVEHALARQEGALADSGAFVAETGKHTGRSPKDRFIVRQGEPAEKVDWGSVNQPLEPAAFDALAQQIRSHLDGHELWVVDGYVGADPDYRIRVRVVTELAWHALFAHQLFRRPEPGELASFEPDFHLICAPSFLADPSRDGARSETFIGLDLERKQVVICGTAYAGEIKKSLFTAANYLLPTQDVLTMHCSANAGEDDVALFFGLSGTGKTTLSADSSRRLIGDDETGWSENGTFNLEGGCYAKCISLSEDKEPQIWRAIRFGSALENVVLDETTREPDYDNDSLTENTRAVYPLDFIEGFVPEGMSGHAKAIVFLTADAFGVLPPVSILDREGAMYHFLSGFTSKLAGTEVGLGSEPEATFSACFGSPFMPLAPSVYAEMLGDRIERHKASVFLINTGWTGGPFGVGERISLPLTRAIVRAAVAGALQDAETQVHPIFNLQVPLTCPGVPAEVLDPKGTWPEPEAYDKQARELADMMIENFATFAPGVPDAVVKAGPHPG